MKRTEEPATPSANDNADAPSCLALDRLLRYARIEALSQNQQKTATLIDAAIQSLQETIPRLRP